MKQKILKYKKSFSELQENVKWSTCNGSPQRRVWGRWKILEEIMAKKLLNLMKTKNLHLQESHVTLT